jgi:hypothetical protein
MEIALRAVKCGVQDYVVKGDFGSRQLGRTLRCAIERQALMTAFGTDQKERSQSQKTFLSQVVGDLRTLLTTVHQSVTRALHDCAEPIALTKHLGTALRSLERLRSMLDRLVEARVGSEPLESDPHCTATVNVARVRN